MAGIVCDSSWLWSDTATSLVPPTADLTQPVATGQPHTQLSLDILVHENYNANLGKMSGTDEWENITVNGSTKKVMQVCLAVTISAHCGAK